VREVAAGDGGLPAGACGAIAVDESHGRIWVGDGGCLPSRVDRVDTESGQITQSLNPGGDAFGLDYGLGSLWAGAVSSGFQGKSGFLARIDPDSGKVTAKVATGSPAFDVSVGDGAVFVAAPITGEILRVAP
jgi:DNA-binding beta-propeller fold protein YncE